MVRMAINARQILDRALNLSKSAVSAAEKRLRERRSDAPAKTSGGPATVGAAEPGKPGGPKSATAERATERPPAGRAKAPAAKPAKRKSTAKAAKRGATGSGGGAAKKAPKRAAKPKRAATPKAAVEEGKATAEADKKSTPRKRSAGRRTTASRAAATSGGEVAGKDDQASAADAGPGEN
jgi:hypothetical protein